jgi:hypothetical protein
MSVLTNYTLFNLINQTNRIINIEVAVDNDETFHVRANSAGVVFTNCDVQSKSWWNHVVQWIYGIRYESATFKLQKKRQETISIRCKGTLEFTYNPNVNSVNNIPGDFNIEPHIQQGHIDIKFTEENGTEDDILIHTSFFCPEKIHLDNSSPAICKVIGDYKSMDLASVV